MSTTASKATEIGRNEDGLAIVQANATYHSLGIFAGVKVKLPAKTTPEPAYVLRLTDGTDVPLPDHRTAGQRISSQDEIYLNWHFYGVPADKFDGKRQEVVGTLEVVEKRMMDGRRFVIVDFHYDEPEPEARAVVKYPLGELQEGDFLLHRERRMDEDDHLEAEYTKYGLRVQPLLEYECSECGEVVHVTKPHDENKYGPFRCHKCRVSDDKEEELSEKEQDFFDSLV